MQKSYQRGRTTHDDRYWRCNYNANIDHQTPKSRQYYEEICLFRNPVAILDLALERKRNLHCCKEGMVVSPLCAGFLSRLPLWAVVRYHRVGGGWFFFARKLVPIQQNFSLQCTVVLHRRTCRMYDSVQKKLLFQYFDARTIFSRTQWIGGIQNCVQSDVGLKLNTYCSF